MLRNVDFVVGVVVYTGNESKIIKNLKPNRQKISSLVVLMNKLLLSLFIFQVVMSVVFAIFSLTLRDNFEDNPLVHPNTEGDFIFFIKAIIQFEVAYSHMIPISLYVATEVLKLSLAAFIEYDPEMTADKPTSVNSSEIVEEIGQVDIIFSDKTGTLTKNQMTTMCVSLLSGTYSFDIPASKKIDGSESIREILISSDSLREKQRKKIGDLLFSMALCHSALIEDGEFVSSSPDEVALLKGAAEMGTVFKEKKGSVLVTTNEIFGQTFESEILLEIPFESKLKSMRTIVKTEEKIILLTKGADEVMIPKLELEPEEKDKINKNINKLGENGLRTLVFARKTLSTAEFNDILSKYVKANQSDQREILLENLINEIETGMTFLGTTAIEDELQDVSV